MKTRKEAADFVLEIGTEEIPARFLPPAMEQLQQEARARMEKHRLEFQSVRVWAGPRRLVLFVEKLGRFQRPEIREVQGPPRDACLDEKGKPTLALERFAKNCEVEMEAVEFRQTAKGTYAFAVLKKSGGRAAGVLPGLLSELAGALKFPKKMAWDATGFLFARPIRSLLCLHGNRIVRLRIAGLSAGRRSRPASPLERPIAVASSSRYLETLRRRGILADPQERKEAIQRMCRQAAAALSGVPDLSEELLEEIAFLVETPGVVAGGFDPAFRTLPAEVLRLCLTSKQKFVPVKAAEGSGSEPGALLPAFLGIRDGRSENQAQVRKGFERVLEARLADAKFFLERDRRKSLEVWAGRLEGISYLVGLGTLSEKARRLEALAERIARELGLPEETIASARRAALLCKADLATELVGEYPELQGICGGLYAESSGESREVASAIREHYLPARPQDPIPQTAAGRCLSIADKMDQLVCGFAAGEEPSGAYDPLGLKRAADGILRIALEGDLPLDLALLVEEEKVRAFLRMRLGLLLQQEKGVRPDEVEAVFNARAAEATGSSDPAAGRIWLKPRQALARCRALRQVRTRPEFGLLAEVFTRARNILEQAKQKGLWSEAIAAAAGDTAAEEPAQRKLREEWERIRPGVEHALAGGDYEAALSEVASLQKPISEFFEKAMVMAEDPEVRTGRLALLAQVRDLVLAVADLSRLAPADRSPSAA